MDIEIFETPGLGDATYLVASDGEAALIDPQRDVWRFVETAERNGWRITRIVETHVHNDYVSGALQARALTGAAIVAPAEGGYAFEHEGAGDGSLVPIGGLRLIAMATPGHTPEHLAWLVVPGDTTEPTAVLTGGSLLVGSTGRTDLSGPGRTTELSTSQFESLRRLGALPETVRVLPTHGVGSFCMAGMGDPDRTSTIGRERRINPFLGIGEVDRFHRYLRSRLGRIPAYYAHIGTINRAGPVLRHRVDGPPGLTADQLERLARDGVPVVDARDRWAYGKAHIPGSLNVEPTASFGSWVGAVVPFGAPVALVAGPGDEAHLRDLVVQLWRVGFERVVGHLVGGPGAWSASGRAMASHPTITSADLADQLAADHAVAGSILDVRQPTEWADGTIVGSLMHFVGDLPGRAVMLPHDRTWIIACRSGVRASIAASLMARAGHDVRVVAEGGIPDILDRLAERRSAPTVAARS